MKPPFRTPRATYRLQLQEKFGFAALADIVPYLDALGISDVYASPIFRASPGSTHGYDVCDHNEINPELGGLDGLSSVSALLRQRGMGLLADFVPNHMGIEGPFNWRWLDVLENGHDSRFATYFDIQWNPRHAWWQDRILVPTLHDFYGRVLEEGAIQLRYQESGFWVCYFSLRFPLRPESYGAILERLAWFRHPGTPVAVQLEHLAQQFRSLPKPVAGETLEAAQLRHRQRDLLRQELSNLIAGEKLNESLDQVLAAINGVAGQPDSFDTLHQILEEQHYRLAFWKSGTHEINYRRFFAIDTLVGLNMELPEVFTDTHRLLKDLLARGIVTGVRLDHIDGLWDPVEYLDRLAELGRRGDEPLYTLVEKILTEGERLPADWPVHGTTGYEFAGSLIDLLVQGEAEEAFTRAYRDFTGLRLDPHEMAYQLKLFSMEELFPNAIDNLALDLEAQVKNDRRWRDWTTNDLRLAMSRIIACLSVYRTYRRAGQPMSLQDIAVVERAVDATLPRNRSSDPAPFLFLQNLWTGAYPGPAAAPEFRAWADGWVSKLQQYTGAIMAKSIEDTFFYRYVRFFGANEVGHHPASFGRPVVAFHEANLFRLQSHPAAMLSTSTHDTKVAEDVRARLVALSELPEEWSAALNRWAEANRALKTQVGETLAPDTNEEYLLYQILLGAWPLQAEQIDDDFRARIKAYMRKALSESKANTSWSSPNDAWLKASDDFVDALLSGDRAAFQEDFLPLADEIAWRGMNFSLVQVALKITAPGVPDFYQGTDLWDFSLVDPDNRRPVDYALRRRLLDSLDATSLPDLLASWPDGRIKLHVIRALLGHRREYPRLFSDGTYTPVAVSGENADRLVVFSRQQGDDQLLVVALRRLGSEKKRDLGAVSGDTSIELPATAGGWTDLLTKREFSGKGIQAAQLLDQLPVAVLSCSAPRQS